MVFGLATKKELGKIESLKHNKKYCSGTYNLSDIQIFIKNNSEINSATTSKSVLRPYSFSCSNKNSFTISIEITNGKNHLDYRLEYGQIYSICFSVLFFILFISFIVLVRKLNKFSDKSNILISLLILLYGIENLVYYFYFKMPIDHEYLADLLSIDSKNYMKDNYLSVNIAYQVVSFICCIVVFLMNLNVSKFQLKKKNNLKIISFCLISMIPLALLLIVQFKKQDGITLPFVFYILYIFIYFFFYTYYTFTKIGIVVFLSGRFVTFAAQPTYFQAAENHFGTNIAMIGLFWFSLGIQIITIVLFSLGSLYYNDSVDLFEECQPNPTPNTIIRYEDNVYVNLLHRYQDN